LLPVKCNHRPERAVHAGPVDLAGAGLLEAGDVGHLDVGDPGEAVAAKLDRVPLAALGVVEGQAQARVVDGGD
jgi:hypothetical protein